MPLYDFHCSHCDGTMEEYVPVEAAGGPITCGYCGKQADRVYSAPAIRFKGSGFYNTDYRAKKHHGAKEETSTPQEVKKDADKKKESKTDE